MLNAIIFDMDGLMIDSERLYFESERQIAARFGKTVSNQILWKMMGRKPIESIRIFIKDLNIPVGDEEILRMRNQMMRDKLKNDLVAMNGLHEIIENFKAKMKLAISTGAPREFLDIVLDKLQLKDVFAFCQTSDDIRNGKPDPEIYIKTCHGLGLNSGQCVVLEDSENGVVAGKRAGCYVIAIPSEYTRGQRFDSADFIADDLIAARKHVNCLLKK
jgi:HAD superfamily hydrolase (TIGR01509 family)